MDPLGGGEQGWPANPPSVVGDASVSWQTDQLRVDRDRALFGEVEFDLTEQLTVVAGYNFH